MRPAAALDWTMGGKLAEEPAVRKAQLAALKVIKAGEPRRPPQEIHHPANFVDRQVPWLGLGSGRAEEGVGAVFRLRLDRAVERRRRTTSPLPLERTPARLGVGDYFGEMALLDGAPRSADVVADGEVLALTIGRSGSSRSAHGGRLPLTAVAPDSLERRPNEAVQNVGEAAARLRDDERFPHGLSTSWAR